ncbi:hypothetical protein [Neobacillus soli]|uniref:hypothetical protein n=1 Tax=Neobacillus soli TaxID=220688 RepID=UPI0008262B1D|nr:hypothetical protein [Neobacillus soli]
MKKIGILFVGLLLVGWNRGFSKNELLEETLYARYHSYLDQKYSDFILCPRIEIERIEGNTRRHIVYASALNYGSHHGDVPYERIHFTLTDTPDKGVEIKKVRIQKAISEKESQKQCRNRN